MTTFEDRENRKNVQAVPNKSILVHKEPLVKMGLLKVILIPIVVAIGFSILIRSLPKPKIVIEENGYYGTGKPKADNTEIKPFKISVDDATIQDLLHRLKNARVSHDPLEDSDDFFYGFNSKELLKIRDHWVENYNWKKYENILNASPQFTTEIEGLQVHYIHEKPPADTYKVVKPLLIVHGWPGNVFEFFKLIPVLTNPKYFQIDSDFAFEVIAPSIPGYGWSEQPKKTGFSQLSCARVFRKLMERIGHKKFFLQGGDWGSVVTSLIAKVYPESVLGLHLNMIAKFPEADVATFLDVIGTYLPIFSSERLQKNHNFFERNKMLIVETGYMHLQATKPDTAGTSLNDSPLGLAAYILEKFSTWTNPKYRAMKDGGLSQRYRMNDLLTIVMIYWTNGNIVSSQRFYREYFLDQNIRALSGRYISIPTGHASAINELYDQTPVEISRQLYNITHYTEIDAGHFMAFEQPILLAQAVFDFVKTV